jgi:hypothetical protein
MAMHETVDALGVEHDTPGPRTEWARFSVALSRLNSRWPETNTAEIACDEHA